MSLRKKTLLIAGGTLVTLIGVLYIVLSSMLLSSFADLEERDTEKNVQRVLGALSTALATLSSKAGDWANWDDSYLFIQNANPHFIKTNPTDKSFAELQVELMLFIHSSGRIVFSKGYDLERNAQSPIPVSLQEHLRPDSLLVRHLDVKSSVLGIVLLPENPLLVASRPILTSEGKGPIHGTLIFGRYLDAWEIAQLAKVTHLSLDVRSVDDPQLPADFQATRSALMAEERTLVRALGPNSIAGYRLLKDIYGKPALLLRVETPRPIWGEAQAGVRYLLASLVVVGLVFGGMTLWLLERSVLSRLSRLSAEVGRIGASASLAARVEVSRNDELSCLARSVNEMLEALERSQEGRKESEERYQRLAENAPDIIYRYRITPPAGFEYVSPVAARITGYSPEEWRQNPDLGFTRVHPEDRALLDSVWRDPASARGPLTLRFHRKDGTVVWTDHRVVPVLDGRGALVAIEGIARDVTARVCAEEALRKPEEKYRTLFEESKDVVFISTPDGCFADINQAGLELFGYPSKEEFLRGATVHGLSATPGEQDERDRLLARDGFAKDFEWVVKRPDSGTRTVRETSTAVRDAAGTLVAYRGILRDVTEQKRLEMQLWQAQKMEAVGRLAGGVAHDFNNMLMVILGNAELGLLQLQSADSLHTLLANIKETGEKAAALTRQLLAFSRRQILQRRAVSIAEVVTNLSKMFARMIGEHIELRLEFPPGLAAVYADPGALEQMVMNLVVNARDAMPHGGVLTIQARNTRIEQVSERGAPEVPAGDYVELSVSDTGEGMDEASLQRIFEPFFSAKPGGTGLGLSVVYGLVRQHGGFISATSRPGNGTRFAICFPQHREQVQPPAGTARLGEVPRGSETLLVAEDDAGVRGVFEACLGSLGYRVILARDGQEAVEIFARNAGGIDLVILDAMMPRLSGAKAYQQIRALRPGVACILVTGYSHEIIQGQLDDLGGEAPPVILRKPIPLDELGRKVREALDRVGKDGIRSSHGLG